MNKAKIEIETDGQEVSASNSGSRKEHKFCGIIMPIAAMDGYLKSYWTQVINILERSIAQAGFTPRLVSEAKKNAQVILNSIVQNIYDDEIVVCDVSGRNPNVMFELGMRLAFNKPVVIVKDYETNFSFDISSIKHVLYPKNMNFHEIEKFIKDLSEMVKATRAESQKEGHKTFLDSFSQIKAASIKSTEVPQDELLSKVFMDMQEIKGKLNRNNQEINIRNENCLINNPNFSRVIKNRFNSATNILTIYTAGLDQNQALVLINEISKRYSMYIQAIGTDSENCSIEIEMVEGVSINERRAILYFISSYMDGFRNTKGGALL
ncbi:MAG: hypothetical protein H7Z73_06985 [Candidatus Saccharibacteria bacterium]|nr:hypothetical protein [Moraxellaceae bacterium]